MNEGSPQHFLLVGNAPYRNRGCEAIVRGTAEILRKEFGEVDITVASFGYPSEISLQAANESDTHIRHIALKPSTCSREWWHRKLNQHFHTKYPYNPTMLDISLRSALVALEIGGDNYSLDYGRPTQFIDLDRYIQYHGVPIVLWGASVGPFDTQPEFARTMLKHLSTMAGILVRESASSEYLTKHGITDSVHSVCDPAFVMAPAAPKKDKMNFSFPHNALGLNLSPLMARYATGGDMGRWVQRCAEIIIALSQGTGRIVVLVPHSMSRNVPRADDHYFLERVLKEISGKTKTRILYVGNNLSAPETKWVISKCAAFAGARTHATIAAISSGVPTLSFAYSIKAKGLNQDVFGSQDYCLTPQDLTPTNILERMTAILENASSIRLHLQRRLPEIAARAFSAGPILRRIIENP